MAVSLRFQIGVIEPLAREATQVPFSVPAFLTRFGRCPASERSKYTRNPLLLGCFVLCEFFDPAMMGPLPGKLARRESDASNRQRILNISLCRLGEAFFAAASLLPESGGGDDSAQCDQC